MPPHPDPLPLPGERESHDDPLGSFGMLQRCTVVIVLGYAAAGLAHAQVPASVPTRDAMPASLTGAKGDPGRGRALVANRHLRPRLPCLTAAVPQERLPGDPAP